MTNENKLDGLSLDDLEYTMLVDNGTSVMVVDDEDVIRLVFDSLLADTQYQLNFAESAEEALGRLTQGEEFNLFIVDKNLPGESGLDLVRKAKTLTPESEFIMITGYASYESAVEALRLGAYDYLEKPFSDLTLVREKIDRAVDKQRLSHENTVLAEQLRAVHKDLRSKHAALALGGQRARPGELQELAELKQKMQQAAAKLQLAHARFVALADNRIIPQGPGQEIQGLLEQCWAYLSAAAPDGEVAKPH